MFAELRLALRAIRKTPGPAAVAILSVALGIGATTAAFSVVHAVLIDPYPYRDADRIVHLMDLVRARDLAEFQKLDVFEDVVATDAYHMTLSEGDLPEAVNSARLSPNAFEFFGVPPLLGRVFTSAGSPEGREPEHAVVISEAFWRRHYGRDPGVIGRTIDLDRERYTIVGVAPRRLQWRSADVFLPARLSFFSQPSLEIDARLKPGVTRERAEADVLIAMRRLYPKMPQTVRFRFRGLSDPALGALRSTLVLSLVAVFVLLAIGCANVSILLLARTTARQHELALRAAIGASRLRLAGHLLAESAVLTTIGGALGVLLAFGVLDWLLRWLPQGTFQAEADIRVNIPVLLIAVITVAATSLLAGMAPMLRFSRPRLHDVLQGLGRRATASAGTRRVHSVLVASQAALTVALLAAAGTAVVGLMTLYRTAPGFDPRNILRVTVPTVEGAYPTFEAIKTFYETVRHEVAGLPDVESATYASFSAPFQGSGQLVDFFGTPRDPRPRVLTQFTTREFFTAFRIPLLRGRTWTEAENARPANVAVVNQAMADQYWPGQDAVGQKIRMAGLRSSQFVRAAPASTDWIEVVGVVGNIRNRGLQNPPAPSIYVPYTLSIGDNQALIVRTRTAPRGALRSIRERIHAVAAGQPIGPGDNVRTGDDILRGTGWEKEEFISSLFTIFAALALALATIGLYSAVSYATALRTHEFGIRLALGAQKRDVVRLVLAPAVRTIGAGVLAGLVLTIASSRLLAYWTIAPSNDSRVLPATVAILVIAALVAAVVPARRAAAGDPIAALRSD